MPNVRFIAACSVWLIVATSAHAVNQSDHKVLSGAARPVEHTHRLHESVAQSAPATTRVPPTSLPPTGLPLLPTHDRHPVVITDAVRQQAIAQLRDKHLGLPVKNADIGKMKGSFYELRGSEMHEAVDILQPRNTPVLAVEDGAVAKLFTSRFGGLTIYQFDPTKKYVYYYAHLEEYADDLHDGEALKKGQVIGFVGTSGNAPPDTPHLHFSISIVGNDAKWWQAAAVDPYEVFSGH